MNLMVRMIDVQGRSQGNDSHGVCHGGRRRFGTDGARCGQQPNVDQKAH